MNQSLSQFELRRVAKRHNFKSHSNTIGTAAHLGINGTTLLFRLKNFGIYAKSTLDLRPGFLS
jgi:hypothetical protein